MTLYLKNKRLCVVFNVKTHTVKNIQIHKKESGKISLIFCFSKSFLLKTSHKNIYFTLLIYLYKIYYFIYNDYTIRITCTFSFFLT